MNDSENPPAEKPLIDATPSTAKAKPKGLMAWLVSGGVILLKFGALALQSLKTSVSMLVMIWVYSMLFGWRFAAGLVVLIFVHEMGHVIAAKWLGLPVIAPIFIPFVGAYIVMKQNPRDAWTEALMAYGGPLAGCLGSWICWFLAWQLDLPWLTAVASASFVLNLFNLIPIPPLDGGRICAAISPWFWIAGLLLLGSSLLYFHSWSSIGIILLVLFFSFPRLKKTFKERNTPEMELYYSTHFSKRLLMGTLYVLLIAALVYGYWDASQQLETLRS